jgi:serine protease
VIHHTVTANNDPNPKATIRAIYYYHAVTRGWGDIGYNFLVDSDGIIYEGRYGGDGVAGAHALGYNVGSVGIGVLGDFRYISPNKKVRNALHKIAVWKFYTHNVDPDKATNFGNPLRTLPSVFYHGQVSNTACAGIYLNNFTPSLKKLAHYMAQQIVLRDSNETKRIVGTSEKTVADLLNLYKNKGVVAPNYIRSISAFPSDGTTPPDDPNYSSQWDLPKLDALNVWKESTGGSSSIKVAVIDTGVAYEDYDPLGLENYAKAPDFANTNFVPGYDYVNDDSHPNDDEGHGTVVASVIAESTNNSLGSSSLAYGVSIMPIKVCDEDGWCLDSGVAKGVDFARTNGAKVINMSIGGDDSSVVLQAAIDKAWDAGILVVASSGNDGVKKVSYPGRGGHVIGVGALTSSDSRASYSNYGSALDLMAPGGNARGGSGDLLYQLLSCTSSLDCTNFSYGRVAGTSFSAPLVTASAALIIDKGTLWPNSVERFLGLKALDLGPTGKDYYFGWGRIRPYASLQIASSDKPHPNGVLIKAVDKNPVYVLENGQKRKVPSRVIFEERFRWTKMTYVSNFEISTYPAGTDLALPDGTLIRKESADPVYVLSNGLKRWVAGRSVFDSLGYKMSQVRSISESEFNSYVSGGDLSSTNIHPDGTLIKNGSNTPVYLISNGQKRWVPSRAVLESKFFWDDIISVSESEFNSYPSGSDVTFADGSLIRRGYDAKVYIITTETGGSQQTKHWIASRLTFDLLGFEMKDVSSTTDSIFNSYAEGSKID